MSFFLLTMQRYGEIQKRQWIWTQKTPKTALFLTEIKKLCAYTALFLVFYYWFLLFNPRAFLGLPDDYIVVITEVLAEVDIKDQGTVGGNAGLYYAFIA